MARRPTGRHCWRRAHLGADLGDAELLATAAVANGRGFWSATNSVDRERVSVLEAALDALRPADGPLRARVLANLAVELVYTGATEGVRRRSDEALTMARRPPTGSAGGQALRG